MKSTMTTVTEYLHSLPPDRREAIQAVRSVILKNLDKDYEEGMQYGMIGYFVPHRIFPAGYHCDPRQPLPFACLASQKGGMSLHLMCVYGHEPLRNWFVEAWKKTGKKLDMGKACVRFKKLEDVALDVVGEAILRVPAKTYIEHYQALLGSRKPAPAKAKPAAKSAKKAPRPSASKPARKAAKKSASRR